MDNNDVQLVGGPCGQHGPYTFYKAFKYTKNGIRRIVTLSEFFFVKMWRDSDLLCIGELQLLWIDKNSEQVLASLRLYFLPENTPEGRMDHGEVLTAFRFYATGSYQNCVGDNISLIVSQPSVSRCVHNVTDAINRTLLHEEIKFPMTPAERYQARMKFANAPQPFEGAIGAIDCTYVHILAPIDHEEAYVNHHGNHCLNVQADEVLAISEKVVIRVEDLITWIIVEAEWTWGRLAKCEEDLKDVEVDASKCTPPRKPTGTSFTLSDSTLDFSDVEGERKALDLKETCSGPHVIILSFPKYCRYRAMMKRLEGVENLYLKFKIVNALGGFYVTHPNTRVLFCKDTFDYPELEGHELLCNHLAPKLKGRPRGKRKKRSVSPGSESNESESSITNSYNTRGENKNGIRCDGITPRRSTRCHENNENREFVRKLTTFMKSNRTPIGRIPSLGYKELNLHEFFSKVQKLGGYDSVTTNRLWKSIFDDMSGHQNSTSAATVIRRHYERFLLSYERHIKGEEYKPLPVSERRRLKSKRGSSSVSDAESSSGDTTPTPSTSRKTTTSESKDSRSEGKPSSLRSVRVKPERQKEKQGSSEKVGATNSNSSMDEDSIVKMEIEDVKPEVKPKIEKLIIKTESMTVKTEYAPVKIESPKDKIDSEKVEFVTCKTESVSIEMKAEIVPVTADSPVKSESDFITTDYSATKAEIVPLKFEPIKQESTEIKTEPVAVKTEAPKIPEKDAEPVTSAATPACQKVLPDKMMSPVEGKENIPIMKMADTASKNSPEVVEMPSKPKQPEIAVESEGYKGPNTFIEVKKRKLDILKEGGLEVTPVRPVAGSQGKDIRPSVIQTAAPPAQIISKPLKPEMMPPPSIGSVAPKRMQVPVAQALNVPQAKAPPSTPIKTAKTPSTNSFPFVNGSTPPKVVQSKSIYCYSEKTVYGNPKDILSPNIKPVVHTPKFIGNVPRQNGGDPVDLSVNSPQKPVVEIMRIPQMPSSSSQIPYNRDAVTKNLYKSTSPIMDGRRLGPNLEITLVGPNGKSGTPGLQKPYYYPAGQMHNPHSIGSPYQQQKRLSSDYYIPNKMAKGDENGKYSMLKSSLHNDMKSSLNIPNPYTRKSDHMKQMPPNQSQIKSFPNPGLPPFSPYLPQLYDGNKTIPPYLPLLDPSVYYSAAVQSLYSSNALNSMPPILPIPTPEQLKFYTELMAHGRLNMPFQLPQDGNSPKINNNHLKKQ